MTILNLKSRPTVYFDATNHNHRAYYAEFLKNRSWRQCPVQFYLERGFGDLSSMIENRLSAYYLGQEFQTTVPERGAQWSFN